MDKGPAERTEIAEIFKGAQIYLSPAEITERTERMMAQKTGANTDKTRITVN